MKRTSATWTFVVIAVAAVLILRDIVIAGPPWLQYDWNWPIVATDPWGVLAFGTSAWTPLDIGAPNLYPAILPLLGVEWAVLHLGVSVGLDALLFVLFIAAAYGAYRFALDSGLDAVSATICALSYEASAPMYDQLVAGHLGDLAVYAALPWFVCSLLEPRKSWKGLSAGLVASIFGSVQLQGFAIFALIAVTAALFRRKYFARAAYLIIGAGLANITSFVGLLSPRALHLSFIRQEHAVVSWVRAQSPSLIHAMIGRGYPPGFDRWPFWALLSWIPELVVCFVVFLMVASARRILRRSYANLALGAYFMGVIIVSGIRSPLAPLFAWGYEHLAALSLFRDPFHAAPLIALPLAVGAGATVALFRRIPMRWQVLSYCALAVVLTGGALPAIAGTQRFLFPAKAISADDTFLTALRKNNNPDRFAIFPGRQPYSNGKTTGVDSLSYYRVGDHWPIFGYFPESIIAFAADRWISGRFASAEDAYARMSVRWLLNRPWPQSAAIGIVDTHDRVSGIYGQISAPRKYKVLEIAADGLVHSSSLPILVAGGFGALRRLPQQRVAVFAQWGDKIVRDGLFAAGERLDKTDRLIAMRCIKVHLPTASYRDSSPRDAWVAAWRYGPLAPHIDDALFPAVITSDSAGLRLPFRRTVNKIWAMVGDERHYSWKTPLQLSAVPFGQPVTIAAGVDDGKVTCHSPLRRAKAGTIQILRFRRLDSTNVRGTLLATAGSATVVFTDAFASGWRLSIDGRRVSKALHFHADGFANGWVVAPGKGVHRFDIYYAPEKIFSILLTFELLIYFVVGLAFLLSWRRT